MKQKYKLAFVQDRYGMWTILGEGEPYVRTSKEGVVVRFPTKKVVCDCGEVREVLFSNLKSGKSKSCGCEKVRKAIERTTIHGMAQTKEYTAWCAMKTRCNSVDPDISENYKNRGITIQKEWLDSFEKFYEHVGPCPDITYSLDRIDNDLGYIEGNVRWASRSTQNRNRRKLRGSSKYKNVRKVLTSGKFTAQIHIEGKQKHLGTFETEREAAMVAYKEYHKEFGKWPEYTQEDLEELGLI